MKPWHYVPGVSKYMIAATIRKYALICRSSNVCVCVCGACVTSLTIDITSIGVASVAGQQRIDYVQSSAAVYCHV